MNFPDSTALPTVPPEVAELEHEAQQVTALRAMLDALLTGEPRSSTWYAQQLVKAGATVPGSCSCPRGPDADGPAEDCRLHGRPYDEWVDLGNRLSAEVRELHEERRHAERLGHDGRLALGILADLDRNANGRHEGDLDTGEGGGVSLGNPLLVEGAVLGYGIGGSTTYVMPERGQRHDPAAWVQRVEA